MMQDDPPAVVASTVNVPDADPFDFVDMKR